MLHIETYKTIRFVPDTETHICPRCRGGRVHKEYTGDLGYDYEEVCPDCGYALAGNPKDDGTFDVAYSCDGFGAICYITKDGESVSVPFDSKLSKRCARQLFARHLARKDSPMRNARDIALKWFDHKTNALLILGTEHLEKRVAAKAATDAKNIAAQT